MKKSLLFSLSIVLLTSLLSFGQDPPKPPKKVFGNDDLGAPQPSKSPSGGNYPSYSSSGSDIDIK